MGNFYFYFSSESIRQKISFWCSALILTSIFCSRFCITLGMIGLITNAVVHPNISNHFKSFFKDNITWLLTAVFFITLLSYFQSDNMGYWAERVRVKLPFLILPFAISNLFPIDKKQFHKLIFIFWMSIVLYSIYSVGHLIFHYHSVVQSYAAAQTLWTPKDHIRFSLAVACCVWLGIYLYRIEFYLKYPFEKYFYFFISLLLIVYLHILSVRSGLLGFYLSTIYFIFYFLLIKKQWKHALVALVVAIAICGIAIFSSPTIATKIGYMRYDIGEYLNGKNVQGKSDAGRLMSQEMGWNVLKNNMLMGVGMGDVEDEVKKQYIALHPEIEDSQRFEPHNQFLFTAVGIGIFGAAFVFITILLIFYQHKNYKKWIVACVFIIMLSSFISETTLEIQIGTTLFLFLILLLHYQFKTMNEI
jgi:O-antigen ligase